MSDYKTIRQMMVDTQIRTAGVIDPLILNAFETVPREECVPAALRAVAYSDDDLALGEGRFLLEPMIYAKILQALGLKPEHVVLDIGSGMGYSAAILSCVVSTVVAIESSEQFLNRAAQVWDKYGYCNIASYYAALDRGHPQSGPFDAIILQGAVSEIPVALLSQLAPEGRLACIIKPAGQTVGQLTLVHRNGAGTPLFSAGTPYLAGFEPQPVFNF